MNKVNMKQNIQTNKTMKTATKMYLSIILSMVCIMFYQYQLSKANFITWQGGGNTGSNTNSGIVTTNRNSIDANEVLLKLNVSTVNVNAMDGNLNELHTTNASKWIRNSTPPPTNDGINVNKLKK